MKHEETLADAVLPIPHEMSPAATARRGTRRIPASIRTLVGRQLPRERAMEMVALGQLDDVPAQAVWKVAETAVVQPLHQLSIPKPINLVQPVRRVGTYHGANSRISMYPVLREGRALMQTLDSGLELAWAQALDMHPQVTSLYAQPFVLVWSHPEGSVIHVPDLAAVVDRQLAVFEVKPAIRLNDPWIGVRTALAQRTLARSRVTYQLLSDVSRQRAVNLRILQAHRKPNPFWAAEVAAVRRADARSIGGVVKMVFDDPHPPRGREPGWVTRVPVSKSSTLPVAGAANGYGDHADRLRVGIGVAMHLLAAGHRHTNLDRPLRLSSVLTSQAPDIASWSAW